MEVFLGVVLARILTKVSERWLDDAAAWLDTTLRDGVKRVYRSIHDPATGQDLAARTAEAEAEIRALAESKPTASADLAVLAITTSTRSFDKADQQIIDALYDYLSSLFAVVATLQRHPLLALPTSLATCGQVTVVDARPSGLSRELQPPILSKNGDSSIILDPEPYSHSSIPNLLLVQPETGMAADELAATLNRRFASRDRPAREVLNLSVSDLSGVQQCDYVKYIYEDHFVLYDNKVHDISQITRGRTIEERLNLSINGPTAKEIDIDYATDTRASNGSPCSFSDRVLTISRAAVQGSSLDRQHREGILRSLTQGTQDLSDST